MPAKRVSLALPACALLCALACVGALDSENSPPGAKEQCVNSEELELIKEGMMLVYANKEEEAAGWFREKCYNGTEGSLCEACTCLYWAFRAHSAVNDTATADMALDAALAIAGRDSQLLSLKGEILTRTEQFEEAADYFRKAAQWHAGDEQVEDKKETDEKLSKLYYNAATAYVQVGKGEEALEMYTKVLATEHGASKWAIHNSMGLLYYDLELDSDAIASFEQALELESDHPSVLRNLAGVYLRRGNASKALPLLRISAARDSSSFEAWYYLGAAYSQLQRHADAANAFGNATLLNPNHTEARRFLGEECLQMEDYPCAIYQLKEAARQMSLRALYGGCQIYSSLGAAYMELGLFKEAKTTFMAVLERCDCAHHPDPTRCARDPMLLVDLAMAELALGDALGANASLQAALAFDSELSGAGVMPDLLLARAMLGDMSAAGEGQLLYMQGQWFGGLPGHLAALGLPAAAHLQLAAEFVAQRRQLANNAVGPAGIKRVSEEARHPSNWLQFTNAGTGVLRVGLLVCSTALRGADMQALKYVLLSARDAKVAGKWEAVVYDWCVVGVKSNVLRGNPAAASSKSAEAGAGGDEDDEEEVMSVMEELASEAALQTGVRQGSVGFQSSDTAARIINGDGVHVLVALDGWNVRNRNNILFHRPCAVQVSAMGHRASMADGADGAPALVDAMIGGRISTPPEFAEYFSEGLVLLPLGYMPPCPTRLVTGAGPLQYTSLPAQEEEDAELRTMARTAWNASDAQVVMGVFGPTEAIGREALTAWGAAVSRALPGGGAKVSLPAVPRDGVALVRAELATYGSGGAGGGAKAADGESAEEREAAAAAWHVDVMGDGALNTSTRLLGSDVLLDTWRVSAGPLVGKAVALGRAVLTVPHGSMASRTGAEHAVALDCRECGIARSQHDAALYAAALARPSGASARGAATRSRTRDFGHLTPLWCAQFVKGLRLLLEAHMAAETGPEQAEGGVQVQVQVAVA